MLQKEIITKPTVYLRREHLRHADNRTYPEEFVTGTH